MFVESGINTFLCITSIILLLFVSPFSTDQQQSFSDRLGYTTLAAIPGTQDAAYVTLGDINIGGFMMVTQSGGKIYCSSSYRKSSVSIEFSEAVAYAVQLVNQDPELLPNISLGFVLLNDCSNTNIALAKSLQFLPQVTLGEGDSKSSCNSSSYPSSGQAMLHYDVFGVISPMLSSISTVVSQALSTSQIPVLGCLSTSDELSDKSRYPFFMRVTTPDRFQVDAMLGFIQSNGWSYISVLFAYGTYGETGYEYLKQQATKNNICIATNHKVNENTNFDYVVKDLLKYPTARVIILYVYINEVRNLFKGLKRNNAKGMFIFIGGDGLGSSFRSDFKGFEEDLKGTFVIAYYKKFTPDLYDHISKLKINTTTNPWVKPVWETLEDCAFAKYTCNASSFTDINDYASTKTASLYMDAVMVFARATTKFLSEKCPGLYGSDARACIKGDSLFEYMKNTSFQGYSDYIAFDEYGNAKGKYEINQIVMDNKYLGNSNVGFSYGLEPKTIALYNISTRQISYSGQIIQWDHLIKMERLLPLPENASESVKNIPESVCSRFCLPEELIIQKELACCWDCRKCRENERLIKGKSQCEECPPFTWPNPQTDFTSCIEIPVTYPTVSDAISLILISLCVVSAVCAIIICIGYVHLRNSRIIRASSRELSFFQMVAVIVGYVTGILLQLPPSDTTCEAIYFLFCLSFAWLYSPLLVKAVRVYRIFLSSSKLSRNPRFVNWQSQIFFTVFLISVQITLCLVTYVFFKPGTKKSQPVYIENFVELACDMTFPGLISFLIYNLVLVFLCSILAFKTRKLPDNFNEAWFIFMCVATTMIIWLAFVPTYFTASREVVKVLLLSVSLLLNHTVALVFLFVPKIYAAVYAPVETKTTNFNFLISNAPTITNRVGPGPSD